MSAELREAAQYALQVLNHGAGKQARLRAIQRLQAGLASTAATAGALSPAPAASQVVFSARPLEWEAHESGKQWTDKHHGFCVVLEPDEFTPYQASWGEGDSEALDTLEEAKAWCQRELDAWVRRYVVATPASAPPAAEPVHPDDAAVDEFAALLKAKLAKARAKGRSGWRDPSWSAADINRQMHEHAAKGDPLDVAAYAMFLALRGEATAAAEGVVEVLTRCITGIDHLAELARQWEPDHSTGRERRGWVLAKDARDDAERLRATLAAASAEPQERAHG